MASLSRDDDDDHGGDDDEAVCGAVDRRIFLVWLWLWW